MTQLSLLEKLRSGLPVTDGEFDVIYPEPVKKIAEFHFTPVAVARRAAGYLAERSDVRVLDVGSGGGKFCLVGAACTSGHFTGIEYRENLHRLACQSAKNLGMERADFIHSNIIKIDFRAFEAVYLFNPFYEHVDQNDPIDNMVPIDRPLYDWYSSYVREQLDGMRIGTRLATYFSYLAEIPESFALQATAFDGKLKFWEKTA